MINKIAVILDENKLLSEAEKCSNIIIFLHTDHGWQTYDEIMPSLNYSDAVNLRDNITALIQQLNCKVIVCKKMSGFTYQIFNKNGYHIFEAQQYSDELFDDIIQEIEETQLSDKAIDNISKKPISINNDGNYMLDLISLQKNFPEISSKIAIQDFITTTPFMTFELICNHLPPWMENIIKQKNFQYTENILDENINKYIITRKVCV